MVYKAKIMLMQLEKGNYHALIRGKACGQSIRIVLDTGASRSCLDKAFMEQAMPAVQPQKHDGITAGIGGDDFAVFTANVPDFRIGRFSLTSYENVALVDFTYINEAYRRLRRKPVQMILGADFLVRHHAVIDFGLNLFSFDK